MLSMDDDILPGITILVVEDEYFLATDIEQELLDAGAQVVGPVARVDEAIEAMRDKGPIDFALLDINLGGEMVFPLADRLIELNIPFAFATGYDFAQVPARFRAIPRCEKPVEPAKVAKIIRSQKGGF